MGEAKPLHTLDSGDEINALSFSPNRYWLCAAAGAIIKIWDLEQKIIVEELKPEVMGHKEGHHQSALHSAGHLMDRPSLPDTLTTSSVSGLFLSHVPWHKKPVTFSVLNIERIEIEFNRSWQYSYNIDS